MKVRAVSDSQALQTFTAPTSESQQANHITLPLPKKYGANNPHESNGWKYLTAFQVA